MSTPTTTLYPFRQALKAYLRGTILNDAVPAVNQALAAAFSGNVTDPSTILQFSDATVVTGEMTSVSQSVITVEIVSQAIRKMSTDKYNAEFDTSIKLKIPSIGDNNPESFAVAGDIVIDNLLDYFNTLGGYNINPQNAGASVLPPGMVFTDCYISGVIGPEMKQNRNGPLDYWCWDIKHYCRTDFDVRRTLVA